MLKLLELELADEVLDIEDARIAPAGPMLPFLGPQLSEAEIAAAYGARNDGVKELMPRVLRAIRSFSVPPLIGSEITCEPARFCALLRALLEERLPGTTWPERFVADPRHGLVEKYHLLDGAFVAPMDEATRQRMVLELGGRVSGLDGRPLDDGEPFTGRITVTIEHAHWANVSGLAVGTGFYM